MDKQYKYLGTNDDQNTCCLCNKTGLKKVIWLENIETGLVQHYGSCCAAMLLSFTSVEFKEWIKSEIKKIENIKMNGIKNLYLDLSLVYNEKNSEIIKKELETANIKIGSFNSFLTYSGLLGRSFTYCGKQIRLFKIKK